MGSDSMTKINQLLAHRLLRRTPETHPMAIMPSVSPSLAQVLGHLVQVLLGLFLLIFGMGLVLTLVLMPIGLPLSLVGVALIAAPSDA
jgi:hypothetical protein